jgi:nodulation protein E
MLRAQEVTASLRVTSLLRGRLEIARLNLTEPSLNLVRNAEGRWNLENLVERAAQIAVAPTSKTKTERRPGFPYIEGDRGRINFKFGAEKKPYALTEADFALWQDTENAWGMRLEAKPVRTDFNLSDTGTLNVTGSWQRAASLRETPLQFTLQWDRKGLILGEGAAMLVLEPLERARARGAQILGEIVGFGMSADAADLTAPDLGGMSRAMEGALIDAKLTVQDIQYVNAHGTGTTANDSAETKALHQVFGEHARKLAVSSTKSIIGHALGAAGALELVATLLAMRDGIVPPTIGYLGPDPACDLDYVPNEARALTIDAAISNSFAFGGLNAVLAVKKFS